MKRLFLLTLTLFVSMVSPTFAKVDLSGLNKFEGVSVYSDTSETRVVFRFAKDWKADPNPVFYKKSIQIDVMNSFITPAKRKFQIGDTIVRSVQAYQISPSKVRLRLFLTVDPRNFSEQWSGSVNGNLMILALERKGAPKPQTIQAKPASTTKKPIEIKHKAVKVMKASINKKSDAVEVPSITKGSEPKEKPRTLTALKDFSKKFSFLTDGGKKKNEAEQASENKSKSWSLEFKDPAAPKAPGTKEMVIKMVSALSLTLALIFLLSWVAKKYMGRVNGVFGGDPVVKVLATGSIGVKKQVVVVDVAGEALVLGISGENITMLTSIDDQETADRLRRQSGATFGGSKQKNTLFYKGNERDTKTEGGILKKALEYARIGKVKTASKNPRALFDENDSGTFAGKLKMAGAPVSAMEYARNMENMVDEKDEKSSLTREELLAKVSRGIRERNQRLKSV